MIPEVSRAAAWFLNSGIQEPSGGVARYYRADLGRNLPVTTEITGYSLSAHIFLHCVTRDDCGRHLERAAGGARFLGTAWDPGTRTLPFELDPPELTYFFDCGIVVRGLLAVWRATGHADFLDNAAALGRSMAVDFAHAEGFHPILSLPSKKPAEPNALSWSRSPGCYQLKAAMAWWDLWEATADPGFLDLYDRVLCDALRTWKSFLPGHPDRLRVVDRLHPFLYFLEGLLPRIGDARCNAALRSGIPLAARWLRNLAPEFERSDVYAQLLRVRLYADWAGVVPLDSPAARFEAQKIAGFQYADDDPRIDGGFSFGRLHGALIPHVNPVSTAFALQALALWEAHGTGGAQPHRHLLI